MLKKTEVLMSTINSTQFPYSIVITSKREFDQNFADAKKIATDQETANDKGSITSFGIGDCITLFAVSKYNSKIENIWGLHISNDQKLEEIKERINDYFYQNRKYSLYVIGGTPITTLGNDCLLMRIGKAIQSIFKKNQIEHINNAYLNLTQHTTYKYVDANLQMDGTLTYCLHSIQEC